MTTIPAGRGSFAVSSPDTALRKRIASSCQPEVTAIWFPVLPGTTDLPISPEPIINANPEAPNSVEVPIGFNPEDPDLCALFNDILPISSPPVYPVEQTVELLSAPYIETVLVPTITRTRIGITSIDYPLSVDGGLVSLATKTILSLSNLYIAAERAVFGSTGNQAMIQRRQTINPERGYFFSARPAATFSLFTGVIVPAVNCSMRALIPRTVPNNNIEIFSPVINIIVTGAAGRVVTGGGVRVPAPVNIAISRGIPSVGGGEAIRVPATNISIATLLPTQIGRAVIFVSVPTVDISISKPLPIISRSATIAVPPRGTIISVHVPEISIATIEVLVPALNVNISTAIPEVFVTGADVSVPAANISITPRIPSSVGVVVVAGSLESVVRTGTAAPSLGSGGVVSSPAGWTVLHDNSSADDYFVESAGWAFNFTIDSASYMGAFIGSNSYLTFGAGSNVYSTVSASSPALSKIHFGAADNSFQRVYTKAETIEGIQVQRIRYEGTGGASGTLGSPTIVAEFAFCQPFPDGRQLVEVRFGAHARAGFQFMIANATTAYASGTLTANSSWVFIGNSTGTAWTLTANRFAQFYGNILINVPSAGVLVGTPQATVSPYREVHVPKFDINVSAVAPTVPAGKSVSVPIKTIFATALIPSNVGLFIGSVEAAVAIGTRAPLLGRTTVTPPLPYASFGGLNEQAWTDWEVLRNTGYFKVLPGGGPLPVNTQYQSYISTRDVPYGPGAFPFQVIVGSIGYNWVTLMRNNLLAFNATSEGGPSYYEWTGYPSIEPGDTAKIWFGGRYVTGSMITNGAIFPNELLRIYHKRETVKGIQVERFRYEGYTPTGYAGYGEPVDWKDNQLSTEITFCQPFPDGRQVIEVRFGSQKLETGPTRPKDYFLINNANNAFAYARNDNITANSSWVFIGNSTGTEWTLTPNRYVKFDFDAQIYVPSAGVGASGGVPLIEVLKTEILVPAANISIATPEPFLGFSVAIEVPSAYVTINTRAPYIEVDTYFSSMTTQVYQWDREFMVDWWGD